MLNISLSGAAFGFSHGLGHQHAPGRLWPNGSLALIPAARGIGIEPLGSTPRGRLIYPRLVPDPVIGRRVFDRLVGLHQQ
jgi:hypothetical protein